MKANRHLNVFGEPMITCSNSPLTGFYRDGCCTSDDEDIGIHTVCAIMTDAFLAYSAQQGNDLSTPQPQFQFPGLVAGDRWCLCAARWLEAYEAGVAPIVVLEATHERTLETIPFKQLIPFAHKEKSKHA